MHSGALFALQIFVNAILNVSFSCGSCQNLHGGHPLLRAHQCPVADEVVGHMHTCLFMAAAISRVCIVRIITRLMTSYV